MCKVEKSTDGGILYLTKMGVDAVFNDEALSYRMRAISEDGNVFDFHVDTVNKYSLPEDVGHLPVGANYWYADAYQISDTVSIKSVDGTHHEFTGVADMLEKFNSVSGYKFTEVVVREYYV